MLKPTLSYDEKKRGAGVESVFHARCFITCHMEAADVKGLVLVTQASGGGIKPAREAAAGKAVKILLAQPTGIVEHGASSSPSPSPSPSP